MYINYHIFSLFHVLWVHNCFSLWAHLCNLHLGSVRLAGGRLAGWPATSQNHCSCPARTVFFSHTNQPEQYFSVLPNRPLLVLSFARTSSRENRSSPVFATLALMTGMSDNSALLHCTALMFLFFHPFFGCSYRGMGHICHKALFFETP